MKAPSEAGAELEAILNHCSSLQDIKPPSALAERFVCVLC